MKAQCRMYLVAINITVLFVFSVRATETSGTRRCGDWLRNLVLSRVSQKNTQGAPMGAPDCVPFYINSHASLSLYCAQRVSTRCVQQSTHNKNKETTIRRGTPGNALKRVPRHNKLDLYNADTLPLDQNPSESSPDDCENHHKPSISELFNGSSLSSSGRQQSAPIDVPSRRPLVGRYKLEAYSPSIYDETLHPDELIFVCEE